MADANFNKLEMRLDEHIQQVRREMISFRQEMMTGKTFVVQVKGEKPRSPLVNVSDDEDESRVSAALY